MLSIVEMLLRGNQRPNRSSHALMRKGKTRLGLDKKSDDKVKFYQRAYQKNKPKKGDVKFLGTRRFKGITRK